MPPASDYFLADSLDFRPAASVPRIGGDGPGFSRLLRLTRDARAGAAGFSSAVGTPDDPGYAEALAALVQPRCVAGLPIGRDGAPAVMGILNVTPDSFSDGGRFDDATAAIAEGCRLAEQGADVIDVGGESTRPGADPVPEQVELDRVLPVIEGLATRIPTPLSIDTRKARVMREAAARGASIVNDVSALSADNASLETVATLDGPVVLMHALGDPRTMQADPRYGSVLLDVFDALAARIEACLGAGIARDRLVVDPGIGFGKTLAHNLALLRGLALFHGLGCPVLLGASRKSFIARLTGADPKSGASTRLGGSLAVACHAADLGIQMLRVHDVAETVEALALWRAMRIADGPDGGRPL